MSAENVLSAVKTGWSIGTKLGTYQRARKEAREYREWMEQAAWLFVFTFVVSTLAIATFTMVRPRS